MPESDVVISTVEAAAILGTTPRTVTRMVLRGTLPATQKLAGRTGDYLFSREQIEQYAGRKGNK